LFAYFCSVDRETDVAVTEPLQAAAAASQTDEDVIERETFFVSLGEMIYHFLANTIDIESSYCLTDKLTARDILSPYQEQKIKEQKKADAKVKSLLVMLSQKSASEFESFLATLSETGQQSVADVVRLVLYRVGQTEYNPLQYAPGTTTTCQSCLVSKL